jgi:diguanylate cyclase (GGDEF)-like protein
MPCGKYGLYIKLNCMGQNFFLLNRSHKYHLKPSRGYTLGRAPESDILLTDVSVSRCHAKLQWQQNGFSISDQNSSNGTFLNSSKIINSPLKSGDRIKIGNVELHFLVEQGQLSNEQTLAPNDTLVLEQKIMDLVGKITDPALKNNLKELHQLFTAKKENLTDLAYNDQLTNVYNRRYFDKTLTEEWTRIQRYDRPLGLLLIDIDHFKAVNDQHGHQKGDSVLRSVAKLLQDNLRTTDHVCRYGGEEIGIILPETNLSQSLITAEKLRKIVEEQLPGIENITLTISIGVSASSRNDGSKPETLLASADRALYKAKADGRNRCVSA